MTLNNDILKRFSEYPVFTYADVKRHFGREKGKADLARTLSYLKSKDRIYTVRKGFYTATKNSMVAGFAYAPFYYGLLYAMTLRGMWTQGSKPEIMTIRKVRASTVPLFGEPDNTIFVHHMPPRYFFGYDLIKYGRLLLPVSDPEKTLIDLFHYKVRLSLQNYGGLLRASNAPKLKAYLSKYDGHTAAAVTNFVKEYKRPADSGKLQSPY